ncbi:hypothetical protein ACMV8I_18790 [Ewingella sp. S1.OA.A_B6]
MKITLTLSADELHHTGLDEEDLREAAKDLIDSGIYFDEIDVALVINGAGCTSATVTAL